MSEVKRLYRSRDDRMIAGVAGGLGKHFGMDPTIVRILFVVIAFGTFGTGVLAYLIMAIIVPEEPMGE